MSLKRTILIAACGSEALRRLASEYSLSM